MLYSLLLVCNHAIVSTDAPETSGSNTLMDAAVRGAGHQTLQYKHNTAAEGDKSP